MLCSWWQLIKRAPSLWLLVKFAKFYSMPALPKLLLSVGCATLTRPLAGLQPWHSGTSSAAAAGAVPAACSAAAAPRDCFHGPLSLPCSSGQGADERDRKQAVTRCVSASAGAADNVACLLAHRTAAVRSSKEAAPEAKESWQ
jgi:hypothetical protein